MKHFPLALLHNDFANPLIYYVNRYFLNALDGSRKFKSSYHASMKCMAF